MKNKKKLIVAGVIAFILILIILNLNSGNGNSSIVSVENVQKRNLVEKVSATGEIKPKQSINISAEVPGKIVKVAVKEGEYVKTGQLLIKIDSTNYEAQAEQNKQLIAQTESDLVLQGTNVKKAKQFYDRRKELFEKGMIPKENFDDALSQLEIAQATLENYKHRIESAKASLKSSQDNIDKTYLVSRIDGIITSRKVEEGEVAITGTMNNPGTVLLVLADLSVMEAEVKVDETDIVKVKLDEIAEVRVDALPGVKMKGKVTEIGNSAINAGTTTTTTAESKDFKTDITLDAPPKSLKPGFSATADIIIESKSDVLAIPIAAIVVQEVASKEAPNKGKTGDKVEKEGVFVLNAKGICEFREIEKGISGDMYVEIKSGLKENDRVITGPFATLKKLKAGDKVKVIENSAKKNVNKENHG